MSRLVYILPLIAFVAIAAFFYVGLRDNQEGDSAELPSMLAGKPVPIAIAPPLDAHAEGFGPADFKGHVTVLNVFASWCAPCRQEAPALGILAARKDIRLYGLVYKDTAAKARSFLGEVGNPFARIGLDADGSLGIEWGVYGVPETFIIGRDGVVIDRVTGPLTDDVLMDRVIPAIEKAH